MDRRVTGRPSKKRSSSLRGVGKGPLLFSVPLIDAGYASLKSISLPNAMIAESTRAGMK
jgi:hypothetical protein